MQQLERLRIENFRGFDAITVDKLSKVNLFLGKNNSGKTSLLEAFFLLLGMSNPALPDTVNRFRGLKSASGTHLKYLFHNLRLDHTPYLEAAFTNKVVRSLRLFPMLSAPLNAASTTATTSVAVDVEGLVLDFSTSKENVERKGKSVLFFPPDGKAQYNVDTGYIEPFFCSYLSSDSKGENALSRYSEIVKRKGEEVILESLRSFDPTILDIQPLPDGLYLNMKGIDELVPVNLLGDGMRRFLDILTGASEKAQSFILIDEIENGLHYSAYKILWKYLLLLTQKLDIQLFITTHNIEVLKCLKDVLSEDIHADKRNDVKVFMIANTLKAGDQAYGYSYEAFKEAIEKDVELRS